MPLLHWQRINISRPALMAAQPAHSPAPVVIGLQKVGMWNVWSLQLCPGAVSWVLCAAARLLQAHSSAVPLIQESTWSWCWQVEAVCSRGWDH